MDMTHIDLVSALSPSRAQMRSQSSRMCRHRQWNQMTSRELRIERQRRGLSPSDTGLCHLSRRYAAASQSVQWRKSRRLMSTSRNPDSHFSGTILSRESRSSPQQASSKCAWRRQDCIAVSTNVRLYSKAQSYRGDMSFARTATMTCDASLTSPVASALCTPTQSYTCQQPLREQHRADPRHLRR